MPQWWDNVRDKVYDKVLMPAFGGTYSSEPPKHTTTTSQANEESVAMETFRRRASSGASGYGHQQRAPGFDYTHWKPYGKRRLRYYPNEYVMRCKSLAPYVRDTSYAGYLGLEERRWAGQGMEPLPLAASRAPLSSLPGSLRGSREILDKMGPGLELK
jgi:hypothetical protein